MNTRYFNMDIPLAPIREKLVARPTMFNNANEIRARMSWVRVVSVGIGSLEKSTPLSGNEIHTARPISLTLDV